MWLTWKSVTNILWLTFLWLTVTSYRRTHSHTLSLRILKQILDNSYLSLAHFAPIPGKQVDNLINDKDVLEANNTIILQVSATPYNLVTKNTRLV